MAGKGNKRKIIKKEKMTLPPILFFIAPFFYGLYYEHLAVLAGIVFLFLLWRCERKQGLTIYINPVLVCFVIILLGYFSSVFYAVDSGMAWIGFLKKLPVFLFLLLIMQFSKEERICSLEIIPFTGTVMTMIGIAAYMIPAGKEFFYMAERLSGCFQYANTYAMFLLCGIMIKGWEQELRIGNYIELFVLTIGIFLTGSRTVFILLIPAAVIILVKNKKLLPVILGMLFLLAALGITSAYITGNMQNIGRFLTISLHSSTFQGRLLYLYDALPMLLKHPFGLGYQGYFYLQSEVQTGIYSIQYVHNGFLQIGLDAGIIPMIVGMVLVAGQIISKHTDGMQRVLLIFLSLHSFVDFDMEYLFMAILFVLCMDISSGKKILLKKMQKAKEVHMLCNIFLATAGGLFLYFFIPLTAYYYENYLIATFCFPKYTQAQLHLLSETDDVEEAEKLSDCILKENKQATLAYDAKAMVAYIKDDYISMIDYKTQAIKTDKFSKQEYEEYALYLLEGIEYYTAMEKTEEAKKCREELEKIPDLVAQAENTVSPLGKAIRDQVDLTLDQEILEAIGSYQTGLK